MIKKIGSWLLGIGFVVLVVVVGARLLTGEDTWICKDGKWVKHGNPSSAMPTKPCLVEGEKSFVKEEEIDMVNPASKNCLDKGGQLEIVKETAGELGICKFTDGTQCEEWQFFRNECQKGQLKQAETSHSYQGTISKVGNNYYLKTLDGIEYLLSLPESLSQQIRSRLAVEVNAKEQTIIIAAETPPLSKTLILKGFQEK